MDCDPFALPQLALSYRLAPHRPRKTKPIVKSTLAKTTHHPATDDWVTGKSEQHLLS